MCLLHQRPSSKRGPTPVASKTPGLISVRRDRPQLLGDKACRFRFDLFTLPDMLPPSRVLSDARLFSVRIHESMDAIDAQSWNALVDADLPFLRHEFLAAMEHHSCVGEHLGWIPRPLGLYDESGRLLAAAPGYIKLNSYGELVFDWSWADAYRRHGLPYYPKLVITSPYTPATGTRILTGDHPQREELASALIRGALEIATRMEVSSLHWLFTTETEHTWLCRDGLLGRTGCQFHWHNRGYASFNDFLADFTAEKRKKLNRERRRVKEAGIEFRWLGGGEVTEEEWSIFHRLYRSTFDKYGGLATLTLGFFREIARLMGENLLLVFAYLGSQPLAAAFNLVGNKTLYGRHWGTDAEYDSLHFETCYYQGLEYCIRHRLERFEPGAQGEHKLSRGFLPTPIYSAHWIAHPGFRQAIGRFLEEESSYMNEYMAGLAEHSPYRRAD